MKVKLHHSHFNDCYYDHLEAQHRTQIFFGGSSSGKSVFLAQRAVIDVTQGRNYLIIRQVGKTIRRSVYNEIVKVINDFELSEYFKVNQSDLIITFIPTGSQMLFASLDDPEKIKSITPAKGVLTDVWVEEATETNSEAVRQLNKRLRGRSKHHKRLTMSFNPIIQEHWIYKEHFGAWDDSKTLYDDGRLLILKTTYKDNAFLADDDIYDLENETDPYFYNVYTLGNWGVLGNVIFKNWEVRDVNEDQLGTFYNGLDFGFAKDPAAVVRCAYHRSKKELYILDELYQTGLTNDLLAEEVLAMVGSEPITCDSAEPKSIQELRNEGVRAYGVKKGKDSVQHGIQWLQQQKIIIAAKCVNTKREFQMARWKEDSHGNVMPVPVDKDNHLIDAIRYAMRDEMSNTKMRVIKKPAGW